MGLRSPQEMDLVDIKPQATSRRQTGRAVQVNPEIVSSLSAAERARRQARDDQEKFLKESFRNEINADYLGAVSDTVTTPGREGIEKVPKNREAFLKKAQAKLSQLPAENQDVLSGVIDEQLNKYDASTIPYQYSQARKIKETVLKESLLNSSQDAITISSDPERFNQSLNDVWGKTELLARNTYGADFDREEEIFPGKKVSVREIVDGMGRKAISAAVLGGIEAQTSQQNLSNAKAIFDRYQELEMVPADRVKAEKLLAKAEADVTTGFSKQLADLAAQEYPNDLVAQEQWISKRTDNAKALTDATAIIKSRDSIYQKQQKRARESSLGKALDAIDKGEPLSAALLNSVDPLDKEDIRRYSKKIADGEYINTDPQARNNLLDLMMVNPDEFISGKSIEANRNKLDKSDYTKMQNLRESMATEKRKDVKRVRDRGFSLVEDIVTQVSNARGIDFYDTEQRGKMKLNAFDYVNDITSKNPNITEKELRIGVRKAVEERGITVVEKPKAKSIFRPMTWFSDEKRKESQVAESLPAIIKPDIEKKLRAKYPNITSDQMKSAIDQLIKQGVSPSEIYE